MGSKQLEDEQTGGVSIARSAQLGVEGAEEARISDDYDDKRDDNPKECKHRSLSMVEASGGDVFCGVTITEEDDGGGSCMPAMRLPERQSEPSPISSTIQAYHICFRARVKAIATCARSGDATRMAKKIDDGMKLAKERVGRKSDTINIGRGRLSAVEGRRNTLEDNIQVDVASNRQDTRVAT